DKALWVLRVHGADDLSVMPKLSDELKAVLKKPLTKANQKETRFLRYNAACLLCRRWGANGGNDVFPTLKECLEDTDAPTPRGDDQVPVKNAVDDWRVLAAKALIAAPKGTIRPDLIDVRIRTPMTAALRGLTQNAALSLDARNQCETALKLV